MHRAYLQIMVLIFLGFASPLLAADPVAIRHGEALARSWCTECHEVRANRYTSPNVNAPSFTDLANDARLSQVSLRVLLRTPHATMPQIMFTDEQLGDVVAYILSLRTQP
jgi:mono/diheme cytochrome c family protein